MRHDERQFDDQGQREQGQRDQGPRDEHRDRRSQSDVATRNRGDMDDRSGRGQQQSGGDWTGYVVPYRYYGPGYRGVGYYSVMYQGSDQDGGEQASGGSEWAGQGQSGDRTRGSMERSSDQRFGDRQGGNQGGQGSSSGGYAGRGPKGYRRSDDRIREEVSDRLTDDDHLDASEIEVEVRDGEVTLSGTVDDRWSKRRAEECAEQVMGVRDVMNQIRVQASGQKERDQSSGQKERDQTSDRSESSPSSQRSTKTATAGSTQASDGNRRELAGTKG